MINSLFRKKSIAQIQADAAAGFADAEACRAPGLRRSLGNVRSDDDGHRRDHRCRNFCDGRQSVVSRRAGGDLAVYFCGDRMRVRGAVLRGVRVKDPDRRFGLHICVCEFWRTAGVDNRLGPAGRIRDRKHRGRDLVERLFHRPCSRRTASTSRSISRWTFSPPARISRRSNRSGSEAASR